MSNNELETYVHRINESGGSHYKGLINCAIASSEPPILEYDFDSSPNADLFILTRQAEGSKWKMEHAPDNERRVLEYRSSGQSIGPTKPPRGEISKDEILQILQQLTTPIDFDGLTAAGVLKKSGAWYIVLQPVKLPRHAWRQAIAIESGPKGALKLKFTKSTKKAEALYRRIAGRGFSD
jgi:hypothetical protein